MKAFKAFITMSIKNKKHTVYVNVPKKTQKYDNCRKCIHEAHNLQ